MFSTVAHVKIKSTNKEEFISEVKKVMNLSRWKQNIKGEKIFIKINLMSDFVLPGLCTSPWVIEGVVKTIIEGNDSVDLIIGDCDVATQKQFNKAADKWGIRELCKKYRVELVNLSEEPTSEVNLNGKILNNLEIPKILTEVDNIVSLPVLKTHNVTLMSFALKNQWGCIPRFRHKYHLVAHEVIAEINRFLKPCFAVGDATICIEGNGPKTGIPKVVNSLLASNDLVALDTCGAKIIGYNVDEIPYIKLAEKFGLGSTNFSIIGDKIESQKFIKPVLKEHPIVYWELILRRIPLLNKIIFDTPLFNIGCKVAVWYNNKWLKKNAKKHVERLLNDYTLYAMEFGKLIENNIP